MKQPLQQPPPAAQQPGQPPPEKVVVVEKGGGGGLGKTLFITFVVLGVLAGLGLVGYFVAYPAIRDAVSDAVPGPEDVVQQR